MSSRLLCLWPLYCLFFFDLRILNTTLVFSDSCSILEILVNHFTVKILTLPYDHDYDAPSPPPPMTEGDWPWFEYITLGTDHLTCRGRGGYGFLIRSEMFFSDNTIVRVFFFLSRQALNFFPEFRLYDKNSESDYYFFPPPKSEYFFQQHWESEYFF